MRSTPNLRVEAYRLTDMSGPEDGNNGAFAVERVGSPTLYAIASDGGGWDHVSVSLKARCPTWEEMCFVKHLFFRDDEWVMQYHPAKKDYINDHPYCLHLWRPQGVDVPKPPPWMVSVRTEEEAAICRAAMGDGGRV